jgi:23S rRNA pseudouridine1911/1915/1917 synthase
MTRQAMNSERNGLKKEKMVTKRLTVSESDDGERLDHFIGARVPELSRSQAKKLIVEGLVTVNERAAKPSTTLSSGDEVLVHVPAPTEAVPAPEPIPLDVVYEDADLIVVNKPAGIVVHPAPGSPDGTLVNAILHHCGDELAISGTKRPGIVHRLDKDTSGLLVVAKNDASHRSLAEQVKDRSAERIYLALVAGVPEESQGKIDAPIGRSIGDRKRMAVTGVRGRTAVTNFRVKERFNGAALLEVKLDTGRTHQIRVHMAFIRHPILGDAKYGGGKPAKGAFSEEVMAAINELKGQALHATALGFVHPTTGQPVRFEAPPRADFAALLHILREKACSQPRTAPS